MKEQKQTILTTDLRNYLKAMFAKELPKLPQYFNLLPNAKKIDMLLKFMPYVLPKVDNVNHDKGEPGEYELKVYS